MTRTRRFGLILVLLSCGISVLWGANLGRNTPGGPIDFQAIYFGSRALLDHHPPYNPGEMETYYRAARGNDLPQNPRQLTCVFLYINLPTTLLLIAPFAAMPLYLAQWTWMVLTAVALATAALLMWDIGAKSAPVLTAWLIGFLLANCEFIYEAGNAAGLVIALCVVAAWCFLKGRLVRFGVVCMALSLAIKPHDAGLVWLYFLLAGGLFRKRALQAAILCAALAVPAVVWVSQVEPHWFMDLHSNLATDSAPGALNDPGPTAVLRPSAAGVVSLQAVFSIFRDDPRFYNLASYLVCGAILLAWTALTLRARPSWQRAWLALAAITPITLLVTYHRAYDTKLLLFTVPACALLWAEGKWIRWTALALTTAAIVLNGDIPLTLLGGLSDALHLSAASLSGKILIVLLGRSSQLILLAVSVFYLLIYARSCRSAETSAAQHKPSGIRLPAIPAVSESHEVHSA